MGKNFIFLWIQFLVNCSVGRWVGHLNIITLTLTKTFWPINSGVLTSLLLPHLSSSLTNSLLFLNLLCHSKTDARFMQDALKAVWRIPYVSVAFSPSLKHNFIAYRSSKVSDCIFEIHSVGKNFIFLWIQFLVNCSVDWWVEHPSLLENFVSRRRFL